MPVIRTIKGYQPSYISIITETALRAINAKIEASRNPLLVYDYAEAIDALVSILPVDIKRELKQKHGIDVDVVVEEALSSCRRDPYAHPYVNDVRCLREVKRDLDDLLRVVFDIAHRKGLFVVEQAIQYSSEGGGEEYVGEP